MGRVGRFILKVAAVLILIVSAGGKFDFFFYKKKKKKRRKKIKCEFFMKNSSLLFFLVSCRLKSVSHSPLSGWAGFPNIFWRYFAHEPNGKAF